MHIYFWHISNHKNKSIFQQDESKKSNGFTIAQTKRNLIYASSYRRIKIALLRKTNKFTEKKGINHLKGFTLRWMRSIDYLTG